MSRKKDREFFKFSVLFLFCRSCILKSIKTVLKSDALFYLFFVIPSILFDNKSTKINGYVCLFYDQEPVSAPPLHLLILPSTVTFISFHTLPTGIIIFTLFVMVRFFVTSRWLVP